MRTTFRSCVLFALIAVLVMWIGLPTAPALQKDKDKKPEVGTVEVYKAKDGWRVRIKNADDKSVAITTVGHDKKEDALKDVEFLKTTLAKGKVVEVND